MHAAHSHTATLTAAPFPLTQWIYSWAFSATTTTIVGGAIAERTRFRAYVLYSLLLPGLVYPLVEYWIWSVNGWLSSRRVVDCATLAVEPLIAGTNGVMDFAGGLVVHVVGRVGLGVGVWGWWQCLGCIPCCWRLSMRSVVPWCVCELAWAFLAVHTSSSRACVAVFCVHHHVLEMSAHKHTHPTHLLTHLSINTCTHTYTHTPLYTHTSVHTSKPTLLHAHIFAQTPIHAHIFTHTHTCTHI